MIVAIISKIQSTVIKPDEFASLPPHEQIKAKLRENKKFEEVVIDRVAVESADELKNRVKETCNTLQTGIIVYIGDAFKDRFLFNDGYDPSNEISMVEGIIFQDTGKRLSIPPPDDLGRSQGLVYFDDGTVMQNPGGLLGPNSTIICRVFARNPSEYQTTIEPMYRMSNSSKLKLLNSIILGRILNLVNWKRPAVSPQANYAYDQLLAKINELEQKYPNGMSDADIEQTMLTSLKGQEEMIRSSMRKSLEEQYNKDPKLFCENAKKFDANTVINQMRTQAGWIPSDKPQPMRISDVISRLHLTIYKEEMERLCKLRDESV